MGEPRETISLEELLFSEIIQSEALTRLLVKKGIITQDELLAEVRDVQKEQPQPILRTDQGRAGGD